MKTLLIPICLLFLSTGCSKDSPTSTEPPVPTLDITAKTNEGSLTIQRYDGENWIDTADKLSVSRTWRFISYTVYDRSVRIKGGYSLDMSNPSANDVVMSFRKLIFQDKDGIAIYEQPISLDGIEVNVRANGTATISGTFYIILDNIDVSKQITRLVAPGPASIPIE